VVQPGQLHGHPTEGQDDARVARCPGGVVQGVQAGQVAELQRPQLDEHRRRPLLQHVDELHSQLPGGVQIGLTDDDQDVLFRGPQRHDHQLGRPVLPGG